MRIRFNATLREGSSRLTATHSKRNGWRIQIAVGKADLRRAANAAAEAVSQRLQKS